MRDSIDRSAHTRRALAACAGGLAAGALEHVGPRRNERRDPALGEAGAGVAADHPGEFVLAVGFLQLVGERGERREADPASLLAGGDPECGREVCLAGAAVADQDHRLAVSDPRALRQGGDRGLRDPLVLIEAEVLQVFQRGEPGVDQAALLASFGAFGDLGLHERGEIGDRWLLLAGRFVGEGLEAPADREELQLGGVRDDHRLKRRGPRVLRRAYERSSISAS
jgi:hypothetical protein